MRDLENIRHMKICHRNFDDAEVSDHLIDYLAECIKWANMKDGYNFVKVIFTKNKDLIKSPQLIKTIKKPKEIEYKIEKYYKEKKTNLLSYILKQFKRKKSN